MKYLVLSTQHEKLQNQSLGIVKDNKQIENIDNLNYLLTSTSCLIRIDINLEETNKFYKNLIDIAFEYQGKQKILPQGIILDQCYIDFLGLKIENFLSLKIFENENTEIQTEENIKKPQKNRGSKKL
jgi:hypothetical protein